MSKESTSGMISQRAAGGGKQYGVPYGMPVSAALPAGAETDSICTCPNPLQKMPA